MQAVRSTTHLRDVPGHLPALVLQGGWPRSESPRPRRTREAACARSDTSGPNDGRMASLSVKHTIAASCCRASIARREVACMGRRARSQIEHDETERSRAHKKVGRLRRRRSHLSSTRRRGPRDRPRHPRRRADRTGASFRPIHAVGSPRRCASSTSRNVSVNGAPATDAEISMRARGDSSPFSFKAVDGSRRASLRTGGAASLSEKALSPHSSTRRTSTTLPEHLHVARVGNDRLVGVVLRMELDAAALQAGDA